MLYYLSTIPSPVGPLTLASDGEALTGLWIEGQKYFRSTVPDGEKQSADLPIFHTAKSWLDRYFAGEKPALSGLLLRPAGGKFRQEVWKLLCEIPYGELTTYGALASRMAKLLGRAHMSAQVVGGAVGHNPISILIPCHRVVGANGSLTGYAGGIDLKRKLLRHEGADLSRLSVPKTGTAL